MLQEGVLKAGFHVCPLLPDGLRRLRLGLRIGLGHRPSVGRQDGAEVLQQVLVERIPRLHVEVVCVVTWLQ